MEYHCNSLQLMVTPILPHDQVVGGTLDVKVSIIAYIVFNFVPCSALTETLPQSDLELADEAGVHEGCARCGCAFVPHRDQHGHFQPGNS